MYESLMTRTLMLLIGVQIIICSATVMYQRGGRLTTGERYETG